MKKGSFLRKQRGVISVYVGVCIITFIIVLSATYTIAATSRKGQIKTLIKIKEVYESANPSSKELSELPKLLDEVKAARIGTTEYTSLQSAINAVPENNTQTTIVLLKNIEENVSIKEQQNIILNLDNKSLENASEESVIELSGTLAIQNGSVRKQF